MTTTTHSSGPVLDAVDRALAVGTGFCLEEYGLAVVTDIELLEEHANHFCICEADAGWKLIRPDGRSVMLYPLSGGAS